MSVKSSCLDCPHCVKHGAILLRSCSVTREGVRESSILIECEARPELGLFEPFRGVFECPAAELNDKLVAIAVD